MPGYIVIFNLKQENSTREYRTLSSLIDRLSPGPFYSSPDQVLPYAVLFHWHQPIDDLSQRIREHLYDGDEMMLLSVSEGSSVLSHPESAQQFQEFLSGL